MRYFRVAVISLTLAATPLVAQTADEDRGFIAGLLEDALGGEGRTVRIEGFAGALSSTATVARITIADPDGIWLALDNVTLEWTRSALLQGRIDIQTLAAEQISLPRLPQSVPSDDLPAPEASVFRLPDLPVSVQIDSLAANRIVLGAPVLGEAAEMSLAATLSLAEGDGAVTLQAQRIDGAEGVLSVVGRFANADESLALDLQFAEGPGGLVARAANLPGTPAVDLQVRADGTLQNLMGNLQLSTDGAVRLSGDVSVETGEDDLTRFAADLGGDLTPLLDPSLHALIGPNSQLIAEGTRDETGQTSLDQFRLTTATADLEGQVILAATGWPTRADISGQLANADGSPLVLPGDGTPTRLARAELDIQYGTNGGQDWTGTITALGLDTSAAGFDRLSLTGSGTIDPQAPALDGRFNYAATGFAPTDPALLEALGPEFGGDVSLSYAGGTPLQISDLTLQTDGLALFGDLEIGALNDGVPVTFDLRVQADDFARFAALAGQPLGGSGDVSVTGEAALGGVFDVQVTGQTNDLTVGVPQADAVFAGRARLRVDAKRDETGVLLRDMFLRTDQAEVLAKGRLSSQTGDLQLDLALQDLGLLVPGYDGPMQAVGTFGFDQTRWRGQFDVDSPLADTLKLAGEGGLPQGATLTDALVQFDLTGPVIQDPALARAVGDAVSGTVQARYSTRQLDVPVLHLTAGNLSVNGQASVAELSEPFQTDFSVTADAKALSRFADLAGVPLRGAAVVEIAGQGNSTGDVTADVSGTLRNIAIGQAQVDALLSGVTQLTAQIARAGDRLALRDAEISNDQARITVEAEQTGAQSTVSLTAALPRVAVVAAGVPGALNLTADLNNQGDGWQGEAQFTGPYASTGQVQADLTGAALITFDAGLPDVAALGAPFGGPLSLTGRVSQDGSVWSTRTDVSGPGGTSALITGGLTPSLDVRAVGDLPLGLLNPLVAPRNIAGQAAFDLTVAGTPSLEAVTGQVQISDTTIVSPSERLSLLGVAGTVGLAAGRATLNLTGRGLEGGGLTVTGPINVTTGLDADLRIALDGLEISDPQLYRTSVDGTVSLVGPLSGGARISGDLALGETNITVPSTFLGGLSPLPDVTHIGATRPVMRTLQRAGVGLDGSGSSRTASRRPFGLDLNIAAPGRVFVRGRGLDAELGGDLRISGTTANIISSGGVELIRGRLDILGQRFVVDEGRVQLLGDFDPFLRFVANTETDTNTVSVVLEGRASSPEVSFQSSPSLPEDEVLAQLLFGKDLRQLSALQALELANAVATLAGRGGQGLVARLRDSFALDDLDITSDAEGNTQLRAGKYITENVYTDVTVGQDSRPEVSINIDLTSDITARGRLGSDGETSLGIFFERDY